MFDVAVHQLLLIADTAAQVPWMVHTLVTAPDRATAIQDIAARLPEVLTGDNAFQVMQYVIRCNEKWASFDPNAVAAGGAHSYHLGPALANARHWQQACRLFPAAGKAAEIPQATVSDVPVLLFNGSADPQDPPSNMAGAADLWPHSRRLVEPHQSHSISQWACQETVIDAFMELGTVDGLNTDCVATLAPPRFPAG